MSLLAASLAALVAAGPASTPRPATKARPESPAAQTAQTGQAAQTAPGSTSGLSPRVQQRLRRLAGDASIVAHTAPAVRLTVKGVSFNVHGATDAERAAIQSTLQMLPASHIKAIPRIVVADSGGQGIIKRGGNSVDQVTADRLNRAGVHKELAEAGYPEVARLEVTHESFKRVHHGVWGTLLHETGHFVDHRFHLTRQIHAEDLGDVSYDGRHQDGKDSRGPLMERLAEAYRMHWQNSLRDQTAKATMDRLLAAIPAQ